MRIGEGDKKNKMKFKKKSKIRRYEERKKRNDRGIIVNLKKKMKIYF